MRKRKYTKEVLEPIVNESLSVTEVCRKLNIFPKGDTWYIINKRIKEYGLSTSHFYGGKECKINRHIGRAKPKSADLILVANKPQRERAYLLKRALLEKGVKYECSHCKNPGVWMDKPLVLPIDHINGDWSDCRQENLRFLCPNCHSQTGTFGNKKRNGGGCP
jgi:hypothetical protein